MARDKNTYAKRQRETLKRQKAEAKKERRQNRKGGQTTPTPESCQAIATGSGSDRNSDSLRNVTD